MAIVTLFVESRNATSEQRFVSTITADELHARLELIVGIPPQSQQLELVDAKTKASIPIPSQQQPLLSASNFAVLRVSSSEPQCRQLNFNDLSQVEKYEMADDEYDAKQNTVRAFKRRHNMGRFADNKSAMSIDDDDEYEKEAREIKVGSRCRVSFQQAGMERLGTVRFVGKTQFRSGFWVGVEFDEPVGKNDGSVNNVRYFTCSPEHGSFVRPDMVTAGDFPEEDLFASDLEEM
ncbi:hypothetical protein LPJ78_001714 [Coemansia sp. RSA 989]|nr:CAP Gly-rich domain-containing protein [Coemansia mojavensis]KAJ1739705.1 hypothetical protein LPJ68_004449 [Coemansia sp. RSA 1086]KAJ1748172.1 hypothetical protein LPJ79_004734 [Coemansia sp. RSA 1821]KAJ1866548.1 hypothetical protein LPJ78_001714 [Coemansia sp. RSA 989]KAJ1873915.1 hypothetical protein LPJ55_001946 [Coemansia sp. RSA 990]KAJ2633786.1 hypothetical protein H4R22_000212 [Coemansia sp. RSA 1290]KAJ2649907.1 hypothetical protein IWW40_002761 [Coemansia sp. RSA 1250]KAJ26705